MLVFSLPQSCGVSPDAMWAGVWLGVVHGTLGRVVMCLGVELEGKVVACSGRVIWVPLICPNHYGYVIFSFLLQFGAN